MFILHVITWLHVGFFFCSNVVEIFHSYGDRAVTFFFGIGSRGPMNWKIYQHIGEIGKKFTPFQ